MIHFNKAPKAVLLFYCFSSNLSPSVSMASQQHSQQLHEIEQQLYIGLYYLHYSFWRCNDSERGQGAGKVERNEYRGAVISDWYERMGDSKKLSSEVKIYEKPQKKPLEHRLFHSAAILSCQSFPASSLFIYCTAIKGCACVCIEWKSKNFNRYWRCFFFFAAAKFTSSD